MKTKQLRLWDGIMIVMGSMIGSGIFIVSSDMMRQLGSGYWILAVWVLSGVFMTLAALSYGEISSLFPKAGGQYTYITEIFGKRMGFLYGWGMFSVIQTGTIAAVAVAFGKFSAYLIPQFDLAQAIFQAGTFKITYVQLLAIVVILALTYINTKGVQSGKIVQNLFTSSKIVALIGIILAGLLLGNGQLAANLSGGWAAFQNLDNSGWQPISGYVLLGGIASAMVGSVFSSIAWENVTFVAGEMENPKENIVRSMLIGTAAVMVLYIFTNLVYLNVLSREQIAFASNDRVAVAAAEQLVGKTGTILIAILVMISTFGCVNGIVLSGARLFQTMAQNGLFFRSAIESNKHQVPEKSLWWQGAWASLLCLSGQYGDLLDMISFVIVLFYMLTVYGVIHLRRTQPNLERPYKTWLYPLPPILFLLIGAFFCTLLILFKPNYTWPGFLLILAGLPIYQVIARQKLPK